MERKYLAIDLKSFYASVECVERGLDPLKTNLVVADESRTSKTICLAVSPSLKSLGVPGRPRLFEVIRDVDEINKNRRYRLKREFTGSSVFIDELDKNPDLKLDYIIAPPRMSKYINASTEIYKVYLKWVKPEDIHVYSIDEVFIDITDYLKLYDADAETIISKIILDIYNTTGITAT
ncbi:MAG: DNA methylase, partial [Ezakiella sp.]